MAICSCKVIKVFNFGGWLDKKHVFRDLDPTNPKLKTLITLQEELAIENCGSRFSFQCPGQK